MDRTPHGNAPDPDEAAVQWLLKRERGELSDADRATMARWREEPANAAAMQRAERLFDVIERGRDDPGLLALRRAALALGPQQAPRNRALWWSAAAAAAAVAVGVTLLVVPDASWRDSPFLQALGIGQPQHGTPVLVHATEVGERLETTLPDGTEVTLNTDSMLEVTYTDGYREVRLLRGQGFFDVVPDPQRPFSVRAGDRLITAVGTAFDVHLAGDRLQVTMLEGQVAIAGGALPRRGRSGSTADVSLSAGQAYIELMDNGAAPRIAQVDVDRHLQWRAGFVEFDNAQLGEAIAELNRYTRTPVSVTDPRVAGLRVSGVFRTGQIDHFLDVVAELLPVRVERQAGRSAELSFAEDGA